MTMPVASTRAFVEELLKSSELSAGIWFFEVSPKLPARHQRPLQKMPVGELAYELRMQRRASAVDAPDHKAMLAANQELVAKAQQAVEGIPALCAHPDERTMARALRA